MTIIENKLKRRIALFSRRRCQASSNIDVEDDFSRDTHRYRMTTIYHPRRAKSTSMCSQTNLFKTRAFEVYLRSNSHINGLLKRSTEPTNKMSGDDVLKHTRLPRMDAGRGIATTERNEEASCCSDFTQHTLTPPTIKIKCQATGLKIEKPKPAVNLLSTIILWAGWNLMKGARGQSLRLIRV